LSDPTCVHIFSPRICDRGKRIDLLLDLVDGPPLVDVRFHVWAPVFDDPDTFEAALILANARVRGIGWNPSGKKRFYGRFALPVSLAPAAWLSEMLKKTERSITTAR
jgi:hypothetical protein